MTIDLPLIWAILIAVAVLAYVILDGFDLGIGILFPLFKEEHERDVLMNTVAPVWDGNETWLVLGGGGLLAAFPLAYSIVFPALYAPLIIMLLALTFRGVAFEFRWRTVRWKGVWDWSFTIGSLVATLMQGIALGGLIQGIRVVDRAYAGGWWDWLTPFSLLTGAALVVGYALLGAGWLIIKTESDIQDRCYRYAKLLGILLVLMIGAVSLWTPFLDAKFLARWFTWPNIALTAPMPLLVLAAAWALWRGLHDRRREAQPFLATLALFVLSYIGLGISFWPLMVPPDITIWEAAAPDASLGFLLVGAVILLPIILAYTGYAYWIFRGKVDRHAHYH
ncbi:MAG TPA: cytochrome d ubiquinol oxidase subunit II [Ferrovibrio sp.]|uniref:cytochrome d ubiquinol oxidase subunit II n=1 Tax=Ferrovibrio sp. TaxID=1917215 RepID=UPI002B4B34D3|nr:cytochrome d ubiquinol oxidase subunit II [Ferrovibrio sp.]HLT78425.1 cytochrome d ubiquinol oxidase subunit II [Ferrovibrio sp.]